MERLQDQGWYITERGYDLASDGGAVLDSQRIIKRAIDLDLREIGSGKGDIARGNIVLQIQKLRNIAAPKYNEESHAAPRMFKLSLTDGKNNYQAVELDQIPGISFNTPPGTKILLKSENIPMSHGIVLLNSKNVARVLGGKVINLVEKWELNRKLATHSRLRSVEEGGPPPWIPFGKKIIKGGSEKDKNFKALGKSVDNSGDKETTEFEAQRQDAIAEAARLGGKKVFGGGNKQLLDYSVQRIVDQGFTIEQAEYALKVSRNHVERALKSLQRSVENRTSGGREVRESREPRSKRFDKKTDDAKPSSGKVSLFDFLEDKLPAQNDAPEAQGNQPPQHHSFQRTNDNSSVQWLDNQFERLELRGSEHSQSARGRRGQKSGRGYQAPQRAPRFQRNQDTHQENVFSRNRSRSSQMNDRDNNAGKSRGEIGVFNSHDSSTFMSKNHRSQDGIVKSHQHSDSRCQQVDNEARNKLVSGYDASHGRQNRGQHDTGYKTHPGITNTIEKNRKNQSNRPHQSNTSEMDRHNNVNNRNSDNGSAGGSWAWKLGDNCLAKYWEDNRYYNAEVTAISATTCVVRFKDFDNYEEVLQIDCLPITDKPQDFSRLENESRRNDQRGHGNRQTHHDQGENHISGMEFRRGGGGNNGGGGNSSAKNYNRKRGQQRSAQPIYQPPAQRGHSTGNWNARDTSQP